MKDLQIILNRSQCRHCQDIITSHSSHDYSECKCGAIFTDGGRSYVRRGGDLSACIDLSVMSDEPFPVLRKSLYRGSRGGTGEETLHWVALCDMDDSYLDAVILYQEEGGYTGTIDYELQYQEREYRKNKSVNV